MSFTFEIEETSACCVVSISGKFVESGNNKAILDHVTNNLDNNDSAFILDLKEMTLLNSEGISVLVRIVNMVNDAKGRVVFVNVPSQIDELLSVIKLNSVFIIKNDLKEGLEYLKA